MLDELSGEPVRGLYPSQCPLCEGPLVRAEGVAAGMHPLSIKVRLAGKRLARQRGTRVLVCDRCSHVLLFLQPPRSAEGEDAGL